MLEFRLCGYNNINLAGLFNYCFCFFEFWPDDRVCMIEKADAKIALFRFLNQRWLSHVPYDFLYFSHFVYCIHGIIHNRCFSEGIIKTLNVSWISSVTHLGFLNITCCAARRKCFYLVKKHPFLMWFDIFLNWFSWHKFTIWNHIFVTYLFLNSKYLNK